MNNKRILFLTLLAGTLAACGSTQTLAPMVDRSPHGKSGDASRSSTNHSVTAGKLADKGDSADGRANYTVKKGDTLIHIALENGQNYRDLVIWNNLVNPNDIKVDQVLRVQPPDAGTVTTGAAQTASVSSSSGVETRPLTTPSVTTTAIAPVATPPAVPPSATMSTPGIVTKSTPRGDKRPFSETALAELQKGDATSNSANTTVTPAQAAMTAPPLALPPSVKAEPSKTVEKPTTPVVVNNGDEEALSWIWPTDGKIIANFDEGKSKGIDIAGKLGQQVLAAGSGKVMYAGSGIRGYGNLVIVKHTNNLLSAYAHNKTIVVKEGQSVNKGQLIAEMGNSDADAIKLHFEIRQQGKPVDPTRFLPNR
ncbi:MAG: peptidoglycan DD-metalloendopeptidase family protein [Pseudomonadota bacterium]